MKRGLRCIEQAAECKEILDERDLGGEELRRRKRKVVDGAVVS